MTHCSRRALLAVAASFGGLIAVPARAQLAVADGAGIIQWIKQTATQAQQLQQQAQAYATQLRQYANMVQNTVALPYQVWNTVQSDIVQVRNLANAAALLSGNSGSMVNRLSSAAGYANQAANISNIGGQFTTWQQTNAALIERMQAQSATATGQLQVLQAGNELAGATANQLVQIQATLAATAQLQAGNAVVAADRQASEDAALHAFTRQQTVQGSGVTW